MCDGFLDPYLGVLGPSSRLSEIFCGLTKNQPIYLTEPKLVWKKFRKITVSLE